MALTTKISSLHEAAFWLALFSVFSQILAFLRDRLLAHYFGAGEALDIYYTAFRIPDLLFVTLGSLVSISVLVPMFSKKASEPEGEMRRYLDSVFTSFSILIVASSTLAFIFMPELCAALFRGFEPRVLGEIVKYSRILLLSPILLGLSNFFGSIVQYEKRFLLYSVSPLFYNAGIIFATALGAQNFGIFAVVCGVTLGAFFHFAVPAIYVAYSGVLPRFRRRVNWPMVRETALISIPRALALSVTQITSIVFTAVAALFGSGAVAVFNFSWNLQSVPLSIIGVSYSLAAFPTLSEHFVKRNMAECGRHVSESLRYIIFWTLPLSALFIILRTHIVRAVLGSGAFDWTDTRLTAAVMSVFALSFLFQSVQLFLTRTHYALGQTKKPLVFGLLGALLTAGFAALLYFGFLAPTVSFLKAFLEIEGVAGAEIIILPLAFSLGSLFTSLCLWFTLESETREVATEGLAQSFFQSLASSLVVALTTFWALRFFDRFFVLDSLFHVFGHALLSGLAGIALGVLFLRLIKNKELEGVLSKLK